MFPIFEVFLPLFVLTSEVAVVKSRHSISLKCSRHQDTVPTKPSPYNDSRDPASMPKVSVHHCRHIMTVTVHIVKEEKS